LGSTFHHQALRDTRHALYHNSTQSFQNQAVFKPDVAYLTAGGIGVLIGPRPNPDMNAEVPTQG